MELNHNNTVKQTLQRAMENEQHLSFSDSDSADSETDKAIIFSSPARFHSASDSDDSTNSQTNKPTTPISTTHPASPPRSSSIPSGSDEARNTNTTAPAPHPTFNSHSSSPRSSSISSNIDHSTKSETDKASNLKTTTTATHATFNRNSSSPRSSSISSNLDPSTKSEADIARNLKTTTTAATVHATINRHSSSPRSSSISSNLDDFTKSGTDKARNSNTATPATINRDSTKVESPARLSISSDQISLPRDSFTLENNRPSAPPTGSPPEKPLVPEAVVKRSIKEEPLALVKADLFVGDGTDSVKEGGDGGNGNRRRKGRPQLSILRKAKRDEMVKKAALGFRIFGLLFCLVSFSVMAADRNKGWALDSFERYKEFRYCMSVNVIGFVYSGVQAFDLAYHSATGKNAVQHHLRYMFDFALDQVVTYLLISASSSAATRIDDWQSNWGKDKFPDMATASVAMSFLAFAALAFSSLISGYVLCNSRST